MSLLTAFGLFAVSAMLVCYALEKRGPAFVLAFAGSCLLGSAYGFLQGAWPFGLVEAVWSAVAVRRWWQARKAARKMVSFRSGSDPSPDVQGVRSALNPEDREAIVRARRLAAETVSGIRASVSEAVPGCGCRPENRGIQHRVPGASGGRAGVDCCATGVSGTRGSHPSSEGRD
jgi:hypothetical protein